VCVGDAALCQITLTACYKSGVCVGVIDNHASDDADWPARAADAAESPSNDTA